MGLFLQTVILPDCDEACARRALERAEQTPYPVGKLLTNQCQFRSFPHGTCVLMNERCCRYADLAEELSRTVNGPALLLYIYDGDFWGYFFYDKGRRMDAFLPIPDYFSPVSEEEAAACAGSSRLIADYFHVQEAAVRRYLVRWTGQNRMGHDSERAYPDDEFGRCTEWQMADFMNRLGYPYLW